MAPCSDSEEGVVPVYQRVGPIAASGGAKFLGPNGHAVTHPMHQADQRPQIPRLRTGALSSSLAEQ
eukprot:15470692-Alexandrium_andersonii.AAC.1